MNTNTVFSPKDEDGDGCNTPKIVTALITPAAHSNSATSGNSVFWREKIETQGKKLNRLLMIYLQRKENFIGRALVLKQIAK